MLLDEASITIVTDSNGDGVGFLPVNGELLELYYIKTDYADGVDVSVTWERSGRTVWSETDLNSSKTISIAAALSNSSGSAVTNLYTTPFGAGDRLRIAVSSGGSARIGAFGAKFRQAAAPDAHRFRTPAGGVIS